MASEAAFNEIEPAIIRYKPYKRSAILQQWSRSCLPQTSTRWSRSCHQIVCPSVRKEILLLRPNRILENRAAQYFYSLGTFGSFVLLLKLRPIGAAVGGDVVRVLLDDGEHDHLEDHQDVLDSLLDVLHVQPEMVGLDHAYFGQNIERKTLQRK